jgi:hypothetical protein
MSIEAVAGRLLLAVHVPHRHMFKIILVETNDLPYHPNILRWHSQRELKYMRTAELGRATCYHMGMPLVLGIVGK